MLRFETCVSEQVPFPLDWLANDPDAQQNIAGEDQDWFCPAHACTRCRLAENPLYRPLCSLPPAMAEERRRQLQAEGVAQHARQPGTIEDCDTPFTRCYSCPVSLCRDCLPVVNSSLNSRFFTVSVLHLGHSLLPDVSHNKYS